MFGEIIPASILTGPAQLQIAATLTPLVYVVLVIFFPIAYPLSLLLDRIIGHDEGVTMYSRREIVTMMRIQHEEGMRRTNDFRDTMNHDEVTIIGGALTFRDQIVSNVMTPLHQVFMIHINDRLSYQVCQYSLPPPPSLLFFPDPSHYHWPECRRCTTFSKRDILVFRCTTRIAMIL